MFSTQLLLADREGAFKQRLRFAIPALHSVEGCQVVEAGGRVGMGGSQLLLVDRESTLIQWLRFSILPLQAVEESQVVEATSRRDGWLLTAARR